MSNAPAAMPAAASLAVLTILSSLFSRSPAPKRHRPSERPCRSCNPMLAQDREPPQRTRSGRLLFHRGPGTARLARSREPRRKAMAALTPNAKNHAGLGPKASRSVHIDDLPWEKTRFDGCDVKTLLVERDSGLVTVLLKMQPGAVLPDHEHVLIEQTYMIEGRLVDKEGPEAGLEVGPGDFVWRPAGSRHAGRTHA